MQYRTNQKGPATGPSDSRDALSVTAALSIAKNALENLTLTIVGEVSEVNAKAGYKAVYFTVKDKQSSLPCMMWINKYRAAGIQISQGDVVELTGRFSLYAATGRMSFDVSALRLAGEGELRKRIADLARKLRAEGLMDASRKKPIPALPETVGIVTSPRGDAVHDVLRTMRRRFPLARVVMAGIPVEGPGAAEGIAGALQSIDSAGCDVILLVRGGGSLESLMPFNDERLARTIAACRTPVITGIGHEPDTTIADMVADLRASTPTGAALAAVPETETILSELQQRGSSVSAQMKRRLERSMLVLDRYATRPVFEDPNLLFASEAMTLDRYSERLGRMLPLAARSKKPAIDALQARLARAIPAGLVRDSMKLEALEDRLKATGPSMIAPFGHAMAQRAGRLEALSPLSILARGYSMAQTPDGGVVTRGADVSAGQAMNVTVSDAVIHCTVESVDERKTHVR